MKLIKLLTYYLILTSCSLSASKIKDGFEALQIFDYFKAKSIFYSELKKSHKSAAAYGLATIFYRTDNPFSNVDSASKYISLSGNYYKSTRIQESYFSYKIDSLSILKTADSIALKAYEIALRTNSAFAFEQFILKNPFAPSAYHAAALKKRDQILYKHIQSIYNSDSTKLFLLKYPQSHFYSDLCILFDKQVYEEQTVTKSAEAYINFINKFPTNKFVSLAQDELFEIYKGKNNLQGLEFYVHHYQNSAKINEAWKLLYALTVKSFNNEELLSFIKSYPDFPFKESINKDIELNNKLLLPINDSDFVNFIDSSGAIKIAQQFDAATAFKEGVAVVVRGDSAYFINKENKNVFNTSFTEAFPFYNGIAPVNKNGNWFLINRQGQEIAGPFDDLSEQSEQLYIVKKNNRYGAIDIYGHLVIDPQFEHLGDFKNGKAYYIEKGLYGFITKQGVAYNARYQWISSFDENNIAIVKLNGGYGLINNSDSLILKSVYDLIIKADNSCFILVKNNKYGFYSSKNCFISDLDNDFKKELSASYYTNGVWFKLNKNNKQALMDENGKIKIDFGLYDEIGFAQNNLIKVKRKNKFGFIDKKLNLAIPLKYSDANDFNNGLSICKTKNETVLIDIKGTEIYKTEGQISVISNSYFWIEEDESNSVIDKKGKLLFSPVSSYQIIDLKNNDNGGQYLILEFENNLKKVVKL